jgi:hypothetical protein
MAFYGPKKGLYPIVYYARRKHTQASKATAILNGRLVLDFFVSAESSF